MQLQYPREFVETARARIELEILKGRKQLQQELNNARDFPSRVTLGPSAERAFDRYVLRVFLAFAEQACDLGQNRIWSVSRVRTESEEFLRLFTIQAFYEDGTDADGRRLTSDPISHYTGEVLSEAMRRFRGRDEWIQFKELLINLNTSKALAGPGPSSKGTETENRRVWSHWKDLNHKLIKLRRDKLNKEIARKFAELRHQIWSNDNPESGTITNQTLEAHQSLAQEQISGTYNVYCQIAADLGYEKSPAFVRTVYRRALVPLIRELGMRERQLCKVMAALPGRGGELKPLCEIATKYAHDRKRDWEAKVDDEATELEHLQMTERRKHRVNRLVRPIASRKEAFECSDDYCTIRDRKDQRYSLTPNAGKIVRLLHEAHRARKEGLGSAEIKKKVGCRNLWDQFRRRDGRRFWNKFIRKSAKDFFKLNLPASC